MVLADLGAKITHAISEISQAVVIDEAAIDKMTNSISMALLQADVDVHTVRRMRDNVKAKLNGDDAAGLNKRRLIESVVIKELHNLLDSGTEPYKLKKGKSNVIMFVGLQGSGKTTTCSKYAYYYKKRGWKTCLVCADTFRAGAFDQLKQNAAKAKVPFYGSYSQRDPVLIAEEGVRRFREAKYEIIIVDTSGRHKQEAALFEEMQEVARVVKPDTSIFVMDSSIGQAARLQAEAFRAAVDIGAVIITKLDGHAKGGGALSAVAATKSPIVFVGTGEHLDEFEEFDSQSFVGRLLGRGDIKGLMHLFEDKKLEASQKELLKKLKEGAGFTFRDMYEQFTNLLSMGPIGKIMSMIPGLGGQGLGPKQEQMSQARIKSFMTIMDSMTPQELDSDDKLFTGEENFPRVRRIALGSGNSIQSVYELITTFVPFRKLFANMKNMGGLSKNGNMDLSSMMGRSGQENIRKMASAFDPRMLQKVGGVGGLSTMMKQIALAEKKGQIPKGFGGLM